MASKNFGTYLITPFFTNIISMVPMYGVSCQPGLSYIEQFHMAHVKVFESLCSHDVSTVQILVETVDPLIVVTERFSMINRIRSQRFAGLAGI